MSYRPPARLAHVHDEDTATVYLAVLPDSAPVVLEGPAALIWCAATGEERPEGPAAVAGLVARQAGLPVEDVAADVETFLTELMNQGLLEETP